MTPEQQRIAIAEENGWNYVGNAIGMLYGYAPIEWQKNHDAVGFGENLYELPDYLNNRNAMIEAVASLPEEKRNEFCMRMLNIEPTNETWGAASTLKQLFDFFTAPLSVIAEAYLRTVGRCEE